MKVILFGASGMVGQGVLRECQLDAGVDTVLAVGRSAAANVSGKLRELVIPDLTQIAACAGSLQGYDACFFCLGVSAAGMSEARYSELTYDLTLTVAKVLAAQNPGMTFIYVSGAGTDSSEHGSSMWARVKGRTENALLHLPIKAAFMFRPGVIQPLHGARSKTRSYRLFYLLAAPLLPLVRRLFPKHVTTTEQMGRAMIKLARQGGPKQVLEAADINAV
ncbi:NAD-dependent epimerase/dehydratase family protein [Collimonas antrihumi]|uniref:NAD-dependent epimerase/dehydratase family protein n=1 Tax=Collimonas antrihumi TaxID=1940615 RepID=UPI001B8C8D3B|nr:NAD(P)H-binding protein [Collimonas antrihumi]